MIQTIDAGRMFSAIADVHELPLKGYIHRHTGEIEFVYENESDVDSMMGPDCVADAVLDRAAVEASPDVWIEIPKYYGRGGEDDFVAAFLKEHGFGEWRFC